MGSNQIRLNGSYGWGSPGIAAMIARFGYFPLGMGMATFIVMYNANSVIAGQFLRHGLVLACIFIFIAFTNYWTSLVFRKTQYTRLAESIFPEYVPRTSSSSSSPAHSGNHTRDSARPKFGDLHASLLNSFRAEDVEDQSLHNSSPLHILVISLRDRGMIPIIVAKRYPDCNVTAVDINFKQLMDYGDIVEPDFTLPKANAVTEGVINRINFQFADGRSMPQFADASFDAVTVFGLSDVESVFPHSGPACLAEALRVCRPGGRVCGAGFFQADTMAEVLQDLLGISAATDDSDVSFNKLPSFPVQQLMSIRRGTNPPESQNVERVKQKAKKAVEKLKQKDAFAANMFTIGKEKPALYPFFRFFLIAFLLLLDGFLIILVIWAWNSCAVPEFSPDSNRLNTNFAATTILFGALSVVHISALRSECLESQTVTRLHLFNITVKFAFQILIISNIISNILWLPTLLVDFLLHSSVNPDNLNTIDTIISIFWYMFLVRMGPVIGKKLKAMKNNQSNSRGH